MATVPKNQASRFAPQVGWWLLAAICGLYGVYAFAMAGVEISRYLAVAVDAPQRAVPPVFLIHALAGGMVLISGVLQFNQQLMTGRRRLHRKVGRVYVGAVWLSSVGGLWSAGFFDVNVAAKLALGTVAVLWFATTTVAYLSAWQRRFTIHREWMIRSFSLSFFFVTFSLWVPALAATSLPQAIGYPLAIVLSWALNLLVAEMWIRQTRQRANPGRSVQGAV